MHHKPPVISTHGGAREVPKVTVVQVPDEVAEHDAAAEAPPSTPAATAGSREDFHEYTAAEADVLSFPGKKERARRKGSRRPLILGIGAGTVLLIAALMAVVLFTPALAVRTIDVDGTQVATSDQIQSALAPLQNQPLAQITDTRVQELLQPLPQVKSANIEARPPSTLLVHVQERVPVAVLKNGDDFLLIDPDGKELGTTSDPATAKLPLIDGGSEQIGKDTFKAITAVLAALPEDVRSQMTSAAAKSPDSVELTLQDEKKVIWGNSADMHRKADALAALLTYQPKQEPGKPAPPPIQVYDVSAPGHPVVK